MRTAGANSRSLMDDLPNDPDSEATIDAWLGVVARLMRLPDSVRIEICDELRAHLRERVRDLLLSGGGSMSERDAVRTAIEELGETAHLARRFEAANQPRSRRLFMHALLTLIGTGVVAAGVISIARNDAASSTSQARYEAQHSTAIDPPKSLAEVKCAVSADASMREALNAVIKQTKLGLMVDWSAIEADGVETQQPLGLSLENTPGAQALTLIAQAASSGVGALDWRARNNDLIEFGLRRDLDRREVELMTYDITATLQLIADQFTDSAEEAARQVMELLATMVEPENWMDNGGDLALMRLVGGRLFVQAPSRMQAKVKWILDQLPNENRQHAATGDHAEGAGTVPILADIPIVGNFFRRGEVRHILNPGEALTVNIYELYQPTVWASTTRRIDEVGMYRVSELGDVRAAGLTIEQFKAEIVRQLKSKVLGNAAEPKVDVTLEGAAGSS